MAVQLRSVREKERSYNVAKRRYNKTKAKLTLLPPHPPTTPQHARMGLLQLSQAAGFSHNRLPDVLGRHKPFISPSSTNVQSLTAFQATSYYLNPNIVAASLLWLPVLRLPSPCRSERWDEGEGERSFKTHDVRPLVEVFGVALSRDVLFLFLRGYTLFLTVARSLQQPGSTRRTT